MAYGTGNKNVLPPAGLLLEEAWTVHAEQAEPARLTPQLVSALGDPVQSRLPGKPAAWKGSPLPSST